MAPSLVAMQMRPWRDQSPWPQMPRSQQGAEWGKRCHGDATQAGLAPLPLAARLSWPALAVALRAVGVGEGGGALEKFPVCTKAGLVTGSQATQPPGVHCLDYLPMNIEMRDRKLPVAKLDKHACPMARQTVGDAACGCCINNVGTTLSSCTNNIGITLLSAQLWRTFV